MNEFIITFRESLEATLIIGIFYTIYTKLNAKNAIKTIWVSTASAILASIVLAYTLISIKEEISSSIYEKLFESGLMFLAAGFLLYMIVWMNKNISNKNIIEQKAAKSIEKSGQYTIFFLIFFTILREGFETVLFLIGGSGVTSFSYLGFFMGIILALLIGYLIFIQGKKLDLNPFFKITSIILIFFAAGMIAYGTHELEEFLVKTDVIRSNQIERVWDILKPMPEKPKNISFYNFNSGKSSYYHIFHDKGSIGVFLKGFFGYNSNPNFIEFILWASTIFISFFYYRKNFK